MYFNENSMKQSITCINGKYFDNVKKYASLQFFSDKCFLSYQIFIYFLFLFISFKPIILLKGHHTLLFTGNY